MDKKTIRNSKNIKGKDILLRTDYNVPRRVSGDKIEIVDASRIVASLETIRYLLRYGSKIAIATHLCDGEPKDVKAGKMCSTAALAKKLGSLLGKKIEFADDCVGADAEQAFKTLPEKGILMLENLRFHDGEKANDPEFAAELAKVVGGRSSGSAIYVNDAFAVCHRNHASAGASKHVLPAYCGLIIEKEIENLDRAKNPAKPAVAVLGGAKISTKLKIIEKLETSYDRILIGGAMANNFLKARGLQIGKSLFSEGDVALAARLENPKLVLPLDLAVMDGEEGQTPVLRKIDEIRPNDVILDIGPETIRLFSSCIRDAKTIIWNGPLGKFEDPHFKHGTLAIARMIARRAKGEAFAVAGGGETVEALDLTKEKPNMDWVSTGGGAMLAYLGGEPMPGLEGIV